MTKYFYNGVKGLPKIAKSFGVSLRTLEVRVKGMGMSVEEAISIPVDHRKSRDMKNIKRKARKENKDKSDSVKNRALYGKWS